MNNLISDMNVMINTRVKAFFACTIGDIKIYSWKLLEHSNGEYYIEPPHEKYTDRKTGEIKFSKNVHIQSADLEKSILNNAIAEYKRKNKELISQVVANKASKEVLNANSFK
jgi:hypothetical protein